MCVATLVSVLVLIVQQEGLLALHDYDRLCCGIKSWLQHSVHCCKCSSNSLTCQFHWQVATFDAVIVVWVKQTTVSSRFDVQSSPDSQKLVMLQEVRRVWLGYMSQCDSTLGQKLAAKCQAGGQM